MKVRARFGGNQAVRFEISQWSTHWVSEGTALPHYKDSLSTLPPTQSLSTPNTVMRSTPTALPSTSRNRTAELSRGAWSAAGTGRAPAPPWALSAPHLQLRSPGRWSPCSQQQLHLGNVLEMHILRPHSPPTAAETLGKGPALGV